MTVELIECDIELICKNCDVYFKRNKVHALRSKNHFCSKECAIKYRNPEGIIKTTGNTNVPDSEYQKIHRWIRLTYGNANKCEICETKDKKRFQWALKKGEQYSKNRSAFIELCVPCHRKYDESIDVNKKRSISMMGKPPNNLKRIRVSKGEYQEDFNSIAEASNKIKVLRTSIQNVLSNRAKTTGGYKCQYL